MEFFNKPMAGKDPGSDGASIPQWLDSIGTSIENGPRPKIHNAFVHGFHCVSIVSIVFIVFQSLYRY